METTDHLWERVRPLLGDVERPARYIDAEWNASRGPGSYRVTLSYPDVYELGMANQALGILRERLLGIDGVSVGRAYVPWVDMASRMREAGVPLFDLEETRPVRGCDLWGITLPHELTYTNVLELLDLAGVPLHAVERAEEDPLVVAGGPGAFQPEPLASFFDGVFVGEGEQGIVDIVRAHQRLRADGADRDTVLRGFAALDGVYVPSLYAPTDGGLTPVGEDVPRAVTKRALADLAPEPSPTRPIVPFMDVVHDRATVEILRGCTRGCRFCQAGMVYRPVRERGADDIVAAAMDTLACTGYEELSLTSLSSADHSVIEEVLMRLRRRLQGSAVSISLPSTRLDAFGVRVARLVSEGKKSGLTFAPEAGSQRLRDVINKDVREEDLFETVERAFTTGYRRVKLYFMIGLPTETDEDLEGIGRLAAEVLRLGRETVEPAQRGAVRVAVSVSTFVPKAHTPFQWESQLTLDETRRRQDVVRAATPRKGIELSFHDAAQSLVEGALARGGREMAEVVEAAWRAGARFDAWSERFDVERWRQAASDRGTGLEAICCRSREPGEHLPWDHVSVGLGGDFLTRERDRALAGMHTEDCASGPCADCGVCDRSGIGIRLVGVRDG